MEERAKAFTERDKRQPDWVFVSVLRIAQAQQVRIAIGEISPPTLRNYIKAVKLFCEMNAIGMIAGYQKHLLFRLVQGSLTSTSFIFCRPAPFY